MADHGDHELGSMDIKDHQSQWASFTKLVSYSTLAIVALVFILILIYG